MNDVKVLTHRKVLTVTERWLRVTSWLSWDSSKDRWSELLANGLPSTDKSTNIEQCTKLATSSILEEYGRE